VLPDCTDTTGRVGCVAHPNTVPLLKPEWVGKIHFSPPDCSEEGGDLKCTAGLPISLGVLPDDVNLSVFPNFRYSNFTDDEGKVVTNSDEVTAVEIGDLDGNGFLDVVIGYRREGIQIWMNNGDDDTFTQRKLQPGGEILLSIALGDLNGDGFLDIVTAYKFDSNQIWLNDDGKSYKAFELPGDKQSNTRAIEIGDLNGDGILDIIVGNSRGSPDMTQILLNSGDGKSYQQIDLIDEPVTAIAVGDLDSDGLIDIVVGIDGTQNQILMNEGRQQFKIAYLEEDTCPGDRCGSPSVIRLGDINGNGFVDIVIGYNDNLIGNLLYENDGESYTRNTLLGGNVITNDIGLADINGDSLVDIVVVNENKNSGRSNTLLLLNKGDGSYELQPLRSRSNLPKVVALGDLDNDGLMDFVMGAVNEGTNEIFMALDEYLMNEEGGKKLTVMELPDQSYFEPKAVVLEDLNGDGVLDMVIGNVNKPNQLFLSNINASYDVKDLPGGSLSTNAIAVGDLDGDGQLDIVVGNEGGENQVLALMGRDNGNYVMEILINGRRNKATRTIALGDLDGDTYLDIVIGYEDSANEILYNKGDGKFDDPTVLPEDPITPTVAIALGDFGLNGNGLLDIVVGNNYGQNQLMLNDGSRTFQTMDFSNSGTLCIALGDLNSDGHLDIVLGNSVYEPNELLLNNHDGTFTVSELPGGENQAFSIALGDFNGDNLTDIVIAFFDDSNLLLKNRRNGSFEEIELPGGKIETEAIALGDLDGDGLIEIVAVNRFVPSQVIFSSPCPDGGARPHAGSWCFRCPLYMGRPTFLSHETSSCVECLPDYLQQSGEGEQCSPDPCSLSKRPLGTKNCTRCGDGTFYDGTLDRTEGNISSWKPERCIPCPKGQYVKESQLAINKCFECSSGEFQANEGQARCDICPRGTFQPERGQASCSNCKIGGYCDDFDLCNGGFESCTPGTYNEIEGQSSVDACIACELGTYSPVTAANTSATCIQCFPGSFGDETGQSECQLCPIGTYQPENGQTECIDCKSGEFADESGMLSCIPCPYRLSSSTRSDTCSFCAEEFYLRNPSATVDQIFEDPKKYCLECPSNAECPLNTTITTLQIPSNFWRDSLNTASLYPCKTNTVCKGYNPAERAERRLSSTTISDLYCVEGHTGPLCELCENKNQYYLEGQCKDCGTAKRVGTLFPILAAIMVAAFFVSRIPSVSEKIIQSQVIMSNISAQAKLKLIVSFFQVANTFQIVYGVRLNKFRAYFAFLRIFDLSADFLIPGKCVGSMYSRMLLNAIWPFGVILTVVLAISLHAKFTTKKSADDVSMKTLIWSRTLQFTIVLMYTVLPGVSRGIFDAYKCVSFTTDDIEEKTNYYLLSDLALVCEDNALPVSLKNLFYILLVIWPITVPLIMFALLWKVRNAVRSKRTTPLAEACSFLWRDYNESMMFWEVIDLYRKMLLTGFMLLIPDDGPEKILRLVCAILISTLYFGFLLRARPYKRSNDLDLAFISHIFLISGFVLGISFHPSQGEDLPAFFTLIITALMLLISVLFLVVLASNAINAPSVRLVGSGSKPNLEMSGDCEFHAFLSHIWSTGKDKTHAIARKVQLLLPGVRIWLDVDNLTQMDQLETSVKASSVFLLFYSKGYFRSKNCRREIYAAVQLKKPIYILYEGDGFSIEDMKFECRKFCISGQNIAGEIFSNEPIQWLGGGGSSFAIEAVKLVSNRILSHLPHYIRVPGQLAQGLTVAGELGPVEFASPVDILVCANNVGARRVAEEAKALLPNQFKLINILDAACLADEDFKDNIEETSKDEKKRFLLLYLDEDVFLDADEEVYETVRMALKMNITVVNVHEQDPSLGACLFELFFTQTPEELIEPPYSLYKDIAVPLYPLPEYRRVSLRQLLICFGAHQSGKADAGIYHKYKTSAGLLLSKSFRFSSRSNMNRYRGGSSKKPSTMNPSDKSMNPSEKSMNSSGPINTSLQSIPEKQ